LSPDVFEKLLFLVVHVFGSPFFDIGPQICRGLDRSSIFPARVLEAVRIFRDAHKLPLAKAVEIRQ